MLLTLWCIKSGLSMHGYRVLTQAFQVWLPFFPISLVAPMLTKVIHNKSTSGNFIILISPRNSPLASFAPLFLPSSANKVAGLVQSPYEQNLQHQGLVHKENFLLHFVLFGSILQHFTQLLHVR